MKGFLSHIQESSFLWISGICILIAAFLFNFYGHSIDVQSPEYAQLLSENPFWFQSMLQWEWMQHSAFKYSIEFALVLTTAVVIQHLSSDFKIIRVRSFYPFFLSCLLMAACSRYLLYAEMLLSNLLFILGFRRLLQVQILSKSSMKIAFDASFLLALATLFQIKYLYILPVFWMLLSIMQSLNFKVFLSSIVGFLSVFWLVASLVFLCDKTEVFEIILIQIVGFEMVSFGSFSNPEWYFFITIILLLFSTMMSFVPRRHLENLKTRNTINGLLVMSLAMIGLWLFSGQEVGYLFPAISIGSLLVAHFFTFIHNIFSVSLFVMVVISSIALFFSLSF